MTGVQSGAMWKNLKVKHSESNSSDGPNQGPGVRQFPLAKEQLVLMATGQDSLSGSFPVRTSGYDAGSRASVSYS